MSISGKGISHGQGPGTGEERRGEDRTGLGEMGTRRGQVSWTLKILFH